MDNYEPAAEIKKQDTAKQSRKADIARQALDMEFMPCPRIRGKLGIPAPTYAKYERQPETPDNRIPMGAAWRIADALECSINVVVGRYDDDVEATRVQRMYDRLSPGSRERVDDPWTS